MWLYWLYRFSLCWQWEQKTSHLCRLLSVDIKVESLNLEVNPTSAARWRKTEAILHPKVSGTSLEVRTWACELEPETGSGLVELTKVRHNQGCGRAKVRSACGSVCFKGKAALFLDLFSLADFRIRCSFVRAVISQLVLTDRTGLLDCGMMTLHPHPYIFLLFHFCCLLSLVFFFSFCMEQSSKQFLRILIFSLSSSCFARSVWGSSSHWGSKC